MPETATSGLTRPKSSTLTKSTSRPYRQMKMLAGVMSRCTRPSACASASEWHTCAQHVHGTFRRQRAEALDQRLQVAAVEQFHHVVERRLFGDAVVEQTDRVRRLQQRRRLRLALETHSQRGLPGRTGRLEHLRTNQLDRRRPREQAMARPPDLTHSAGTQALLELITAEIEGAFEIHPEAVDQARADRRDHHDDQVREHDVQEELEWRDRRQVTIRDRDAADDRHDDRRAERGRERR